MKIKKKLKLKKMTVSQLNQTVGGNLTDQLDATLRETSPIICNYPFTTDPRCQTTVRLTVLEC